MGKFQSLPDGKLVCRALVKLNEAANVHDIIDYSKNMFEEKPMSFQK